MKKKKGLQTLLFLLAAQEMCEQTSGTSVFHQFCKEEKKPCHSIPVFKLF